MPLIYSLYKYYFWLIFAKIMKLYFDQPFFQLFYFIISFDRVKDINLFLSVLNDVTNNFIVIDGCFHTLNCVQHDFSCMKKNFMTSIF